MSLDGLGTISQQAASSPSKTAESSHLISACPNWQRNPYEQQPFFQNPLHFLLLEPFLDSTLTNSCFPWANLHLRSQGHDPSSSKVLQSSVLCLRALVLGQKNSSSLSEQLSYSLDRLDLHQKLEIFEKFIELLFKFLQYFSNQTKFKKSRRNSEDIDLFGSIYEEKLVVLLLAYKDSKRCLCILSLHLNYTPFMLSHMISA